MSGQATSAPRSKHPLLWAGEALLLDILAAVATARALELSFHVENTAAALAEAQRGVLFLVLAGLSYVLAAAFTRASGAGGGMLLIVGSPVLIGLLPLALASGNIIPFGTTLLGAAASFCGCLVNLIVRARAVKKSRSS